MCSFDVLSPSLYTAVMAVFNLRSEGRFVEPIDVKDLPESFARAVRFFGGPLRVLIAQ